MITQTNPFSQHRTDRAPLPPAISCVPHCSIVAPSPAKMFHCRIRSTSEQPLWRTLPQSNVLELCHKTDDVKNCYLTLASALQLNYFYESCAPKKSSRETHSANLLVDTERLERNLGLMMGRPS